MNEVKERRKARGEVGLELCEFASDLSSKIANLNEPETKLQSKNKKRKRKCVTMVEESIHVSPRITRFKVPQERENDVIYLQCREKKELSQDINPSQELIGVKRKLNETKYHQGLISTMSLEMENTTPVRVQGANRSKVISTDKKNASVSSSICVMLSGVPSLSHQILIETVNQLGVASISSDISMDNVSHLVVSVNESNLTNKRLKYIKALARGIWILSWAWVVDSKKAGWWLDEILYEVRGDVVSGLNSAPRRARLSGAPLFKNLNFFLPSIATITKEPTVEQLEDIIVCAGGKLLTEERLMNKKDLEQRSTLAVVSVSVLNQKRKLNIPCTIVAPSWVVCSLCKYEVLETEEHKIQ